ncbi:MAG: DUF3187 family protein [Deltaproteobacteria bacterium]|nr:DUF3187 family protein [Deltaproteobacteria bacterium]
MKNTKTLTVILATVLLVLCAGVTRAKITDYKPFGPLRVRTQHPLYLQLLSLPMESPQTLNRDQFELTIETVFSNVFEFDNVATTTMDIDMEVWRTALTATYGINDQMDVQIEVPFMTTVGGFSDSFIEGYHNLFGLPYSGRGFVAENRHSFLVTHRGRRLVNYPRTDFDLSDIRARVKYLLSDHWAWPFKLALAGYIKCPVGKTEQGLGSGQFDLGFSLLAQKSIRRFHFVSHAGYVLLGKHAYLDAILGHGFFSFGQSIRFDILDGLSAVVQLTGNTAAFNNVDTRDLEEIILDLNVGFTGSFTLNHTVFDEFFYQWSFSEDVMSSGPSVDFSVLFMAGVRY